MPRMTSLLIWLIRKISSSFKSFIFYGYLHDTIKVELGTVSHLVVIVAHHVLV